jgi:predicted secreted protein
MNALTVAPGEAVAVAPQCSHLNAAVLTRTVFQGAICTAFSLLIVHFMS